MTGPGAETGPIWGERTLKKPSDWGFEEMEPEKGKRGLSMEVRQTFDPVCWVCQSRGGICAGGSRRVKVANVDAAHRRSRGFVKLV